MSGTTETAKKKASKRKSKGKDSTTTSQKKKASKKKTANTKKGERARSKQQGSEGEEKSEAQSMRLDVICDREALVGALKNLKPLAKNGGLYCTPTQYVVLTAFEDTFTVRATDLETSLRCVIEQAEVNGDGLIAVPLERLLDSVQHCQSAVVRLHEIDDVRLDVKADDAQVILSGIPASEVPHFPDVEKKQFIDIVAGGLVSALGEVMYAIAPDTSRYAINGVKIETGESGIDLITTDGRRLAARWHEATATDEVNAILSANSVKLLWRLAKTLDPEQIVTLVIGGGEQGEAPVAVAVDTDAWALRSNLIEGSFPPWREVIPDRVAARTTVVAQGQLLAAASKHADVVNDDMHVVRTHFADDGIGVSATALPGESDVHTCRIESFHGDEVTAGFNAKFLHDLAMHCEGLMQMHIIEPNKPLLVHGDASRHVLMPVKLDE